MSWQAYVDSNLVGAGFTAAAIFGVEGGQWATSAGFTVSAAEAATLTAGYKDPSKLRADGLTIAGVKYFVLRADDRSIYGKKGTGGIITVKTGRAVIIAVYGDSLQPGQAANVAEKLADYLIDAGY